MEVDSYPCVEEKEQSIESFGLEGMFNLTVLNCSHLHTQTYMQCTDLYYEERFMTYATNCNKLIDFYKSLNNLKKKEIVTNRKRKWRNDLIVTTPHKVRTTAAAWTGLYFAGNNRDFMQTKFELVTFVRNEIHYPKDFEGHCPISSCSNTFSNISSLLKHVRAHKELTPKLKCLLCDALFDWNHTRDFHIHVDKHIRDGNLRISRKGI